MVLHKCDVRNCVNPDHLFLGDQFANMQDMVAKNRNRFPRLYGEANPMSRLTEDKVKQMRFIRNQENRSFKSIALQFGVSTMTAYRAITGKAWGNV